MHWTKTEQGRAKIALIQKKRWAMHRAREAAAKKAAAVKVTAKAKKDKLGMRVTTLHYEDGNLVRSIHKIKSYGELVDLFIDIRVIGNDYEEVFIERF